MNPKVQEIRRTLLDLKTTTRKQTSFINTVKERLAGEYPARATVQNQRRNGFLQTGGPPAFWAWLAGCGDFLAIRIQSRFNNHYRKKCELGRAQITELTRQALGGDLPLACLVESGLDLRPIELLGDNMFYRYHARVLFYLPSVIGSGWILPSNLPL